MFSVIVVAEVESTSKNSNNPFFIRKQPGKKGNLLERKDSTEKKNDIPFITGTKSLKATPVKIFLSAMWRSCFHRTWNRTKWTRPEGKATNAHDVNELLRGGKESYIGQTFPLIVPCQWP